MTEQTYSPGLEGVIAGESAISRIDVGINRLVLRGYDLVELTENARYEEVAYLLLYGELPTAFELEAFDRELAALLADRFPGDEVEAPHRVSVLVARAPG